MTPEVFDPHVGDVFRVEYRPAAAGLTDANAAAVAPGSTCQTATFVELKLLEVTRFPERLEREGEAVERTRKPFALLFDGPDGPALPSALHMVQHDQLGKGRLFINPVQPPLQAPPSTRMYEAVFN